MSDDEDLRTTYDCSPGVLRALRGTFWTSTGWRKTPIYPDPIAFVAAQRAGIMFVETHESDHDTWIARARAAADRLTIELVRDAFIASLTSRRLDLRSALGSYIVARVLPLHDFDGSRDRGTCAVCGFYRGRAIDSNLLNFERFMWGGVRKLHVDYIAFDLEQFELAPKLVPTDADKALARAVFETIRECPASTTAAKLSHLLQTIPGNKSERSTLIGTLGIAGILDTPDHPGFLDEFVPDNEQTLPSRAFVDDPYPVCWWTATTGINEPALRRVLNLDA